MAEEDIRQGKKKRWIELEKRREREKNYLEDFEKQGKERQEEIRGR